jgi:hypothetical protein
MTAWRMRFACWIPKAIDTHSEYVMLIASELLRVVTRTRLNVTLHVDCLSRYCIDTLRMDVTPVLW